MRVEIHNIEEIQAFIDKLPRKHLCDFLDFITKKVYRYAKEYAGRHHRNGKMEENIRSSTHCFRKKEGIVEVKSKGLLVPWRGRKVSYAWFVHEGTRPHEIHPKFKKALRWAQEGDKTRLIFAKKVEHPGYEGDPFLIRALEKGADEAMRYFGRFIDDGA